MGWPLSLFRSKRDRDLISWILGGVVIVIGGAWTIFVYIFPSGSLIDSKIASAGYKKHSDSFAQQTNQYAPNGGDYTNGNFNKQNNCASNCGNSTVNNSIHNNGNNADIHQGGTYNYHYGPDGE